MPRWVVRFLLGGCLALVGLWGMGGTSVASEPAPETLRAPMDGAELARFFDAIMAQHLERYHIPGATLAVVKDGEVLFAQGYGYADLEGQTPFDPDTSLVRIGSITKLFTWTAVMQLVERGALDLNGDINRYLTTFQVPASYPEPITLAHLMAHTAGFEERSIGVGARRKEDVPPLGDYLARHLPARVRPPGRLAAYSNHGAALAGHIVAEVSGLPYEQYVQERILLPLGMAHSTAWEPVPPPLRAALAVSYEYEQGKHVPIPFTYDLPVPDGSISATASDMARFMLAHLQEEAGEASPLLQSDTLRQMHRQSFTHHPRLDGWAHGFAEMSINEQAALSHDGSWEGFQSLLLLLPDREMGLFISYNGPGGIEAMTELLPAFFDNFFPTSSPSPAPSPNITPAPPIEALLGRYKPARSSVTTIEKVVMLLDSTRVSQVDERTIYFAGREWVALEPLLYQEVDGTERLAFLPDEQGTITAAVIGRRAYERLPWQETAPVNMAVLGVCAALALSALLAWPVAWLRQRRGHQPPVAPARGPWLARGVAGLASGAALGFIVTLTLILLGDTSQFVYGVPPSIWLLMTVPLIVAALSGVAVGWTVLVWKQHYWGFVGRVHYTLVVLGLLGFVWFFATWNLLGFRFG